MPPRIIKPPMGLLFDVEFVLDDSTIGEATGIVAEVSLTVGVGVTVSVGVIVGVGVLVGNGVGVGGIGVGVLYC